MVSTSTKYLIVTCLITLKWGDVRDNQGNAMGGHFNPTGRGHSIPPNARHLGDLGNIFSKMELHIMNTLSLTTLG